MPEISIIVPVYRVEKYLDRCVQSILNQTFTDFELILVDDGSDDGCPALCDEYAKQDEDPQSQKKSHHPDPFLRKICDPGILRRHCPYHLRAAGSAAARLL